MSDNTPLTTDDRIERINDACATIREASGSIQADVENIDEAEVDVDDDTLTEIFEWANDVSKETYRWSTEDRENILSEQ